MTTAFAKPENALKRAEELLNVGQKQEAWDTIHRLITSRRYRAWTKTLERIMFKYIELCVEMRKGARDGLNQYRIMCQQVNVSSLEEVIKHFMHLSTERAELARSQADALEEALDVDDLEADRRPEDLMLSYVSGQKGKDRSDRELVTPWFKFLWETYRTVLEILRNNSKLEALYAMTAHRAFQFCRQYKRTTEFRRLCEIIRNHLVNLNKYRDQRDRPDLSAPESLQLYLDTRFEQLKIATELELWQEAFRSVEDIHGLMCMVKKQPKPSLLVVYYAKLTEIFWMSSSHLYHAYAWLKLFSFQKSFNKNLTQKDLQLIASAVVLAALSVPPYNRGHGTSHVEQENGKERNSRMANLIGFILDPKLEGREVLSRSSLLSEVASKGILSCVMPEVKDLYYLLELEFLPLDLASKVQPLLSKISKIGGKLSSASSLPEVQLSQYVSALEKLAALRLLKQVSEVYQTMKIDSLCKMIPFVEFSFLEKISMDAVKYNFLSMKIDHIKNAVIFSSMDIEAEGFRGQLMFLAELLNKSRAMIHRPEEKASKIGLVLPGLSETVEKEHKRLLARKSIIEKRKEEQERLLLEMEREEETKRLKLQKLTEEAEQKRLASEYEQRKNQRILKEIEERELEEAQALLQEAEKRSKKKGKKPVLEGEKVTKQTLMELALSEQLRERLEMEKKLQKLVKTMDFLERAKREEAALLIESAFQHRLIEEKILHEREQRQEIELSRERHDGDLKEKKRLARMFEHKHQFQDKVMNRRQTEYDRLKTERAERINHILQQRRQEMEIKRKMLFFLKSEEQRLKKLQEEEEARKHEEAERQKKEAAEHQAKLDRIAEKQRQREQEIEERLRKSSEGPARHSDLNGGGSGSDSRTSATAPAASAGPPPGKYVPKFKQRLDNSGQGPTPDSMQWGNGRADERSQPSDRWRSDDRRPTYGFGGGSGSRSSWSSSSRR